MVFVLLCLTSFTSYANLQVHPYVAANGILSLFLMVD